MHPPSQPKTAVVPAVHAPIADPSDHDETATMPVSPLLLCELEKGDGSVRTQNEPRNEPATPVGSSVGSTVSAADEPTGNIGLDDEAHEAHDEHDLRQTMRRQAVEASEPMPESAPHAPLSSQRRGSTDMPRSSDESSRLTHEPQMLPLAVGMRVRLHGSEEGVWVVPEGDDPHQEGVAAILVPVGRDDDLRTVFGRVRR